MKLGKLVVSTLMLLGMFTVNLSAQNITAESVQLDMEPETIGRRVVSNIIDRPLGWRYPKICSYYGTLIFADALGDKIISAQQKESFTPFYKGKRKPHSGHVDYNVFGIWPFELYRQYGDIKYLNIAKALADAEWENPRIDGLTKLTRFWIDDMYMVGTLQVQAYKATKDIIYLDRAALQLKVYCDKLQKTNGLFHHRKDAPFFWGRGNGWAVAALTELLLVLPENHEYYENILLAFQNMMETLLVLQGEDGMWHQLLDEPKSYKESSCTGMFLFGMASGVEKGWIPFEKYKNCIESGWNALASLVNEKGKVKNVCVATNAKKHKRHYITRPTSTGNFHGQAAVLWAATALLRLQQDSNL